MRQIDQLQGGQESAPVCSSLGKVPWGQCLEVGLLVEGILAALHEPQLGGVVCDVDHLPPSILLVPCTRTCFADSLRADGA